MSDIHVECIHMQTRARNNRAQLQPHPGVAPHQIVRGQEGGHGWQHECHVVAWCHKTELEMFVCHSRQSAFRWDTSIYDSVTKSRIIWLSSASAGARARCVCPRVHARSPHIHSHMRNGLPDKLGSSRNHHRSCGSSVAILRRYAVVSRMKNGRPIITL